LILSDAFDAWRWERPRWAANADIYREVLLGCWWIFAIRNIFRNELFQVDAGNPAVYLVSAPVLAMAAVAAMLIPARRGARSDPMKALHYE
jgi:hypothetical protein